MFNPEKKEFSQSDPIETSQNEKKNPSNVHPYEMIMQVANRRDVLAKIAALVADRGLGIDALDFSTSKGNVSYVHLSLRGQRGQMQGLINDAQKLSEIKGISLNPA